MPTPFKIIDVRRILSPRRERMGKWDRLVIFETGPQNRDTVLIPDEDFDEAAIVAAVQELLKDRAAWVGRELQA